MPFPNLTFQSMLNRIHALAGRSRLGAQIAIKVRNQCQCIVAHHISQSDRFEENGEQLLLETIAKDASFFVDVGANHGLWSSKFLETAPKNVRGLLFDAADSASRILLDRFAGDDRVEIITAALSDQAGESIFFEEPGGGGMSSLVGGWSKNADQGRPRKVSTVDIELAKRGIQYVDFLKVDVEGYDFHVLQGARQWLREQKIGVIQFEYNIPWIAAGSTLNAAISFVQGFGYKTFILKAAGLFETEYERYGEHYARSNYVAVAPSAFHLIQPILQP